MSNQQSNPHPKLVEVRNRLQSCGHSRSGSAVICNELTHSQCDSVLSAKDDAAVEAVITPPKAAPVPKKTKPVKPAPPVRVSSEKPPETK